MFQCDCPPDDCAGKVARYLAGDRAAGDELARKFVPLVHSIVQRVLGPGRREEWEDACQAVFLRLFGNLGRWEQRGPFCKWLAVVAARRAIDLTRLDGPMERLPSAEIADPRTTSVAPAVLEVIERVVARFPPDWRRLWEWWVQGIERDEMARRLGKSVRTVQYRLAEMLDQLREELGS
jgi:RNA polymerase sigma-70 factor (ECF subfamily)